VYKELFLQNPAVILTEATLVPNKAGVKDTFENLFLDNAMNQYLNSDRGLTYNKQTEAAKERSNNFAVAFADVFRPLKGGQTQAPRPLQDAELPNISVVTLLYNRRKFVDLAIHNLLITDYPKNKIEWVVVEDSDITEEQAADKVLKFGRESAPLSVSYIPMPSTHKIKNTIGAKRNLGIQRAQHDIILFMDDDDHYPETSFRRRVAWLTKHPWQPRAVACTTIACYDLLRGVSAVNTPPLSLGFSKRISEATLAFYKDFWTERNFNAADSIGEGEFFLQGRESKCLELPPQQMIVAFSHRKNTSGRRIPSDDAKPGCFWAFPREYLQYIHELAGVSVEEAD
jgi:glycosyltransferase involved in cell wall biosynthesis